MYATGCFLTPSLTNFECLNSTILRGIILQPVAEPETSPEQQIAEFEKSVQAQIKREKERKTFTCPYAGCSFKSKNKYQKVVSSGLNIEKHHLATCDHRPQCLVENDSITAEINEKVSRWKVKKEIMKKEKQKFTCPYGCGKTYASKHCIGAKKHLVNCHAKNQRKLFTFFKKNM